MKIDQFYIVLGIRLNAGGKWMLLTGAADSSPESVLVRSILADRAARLIAPWQLTVCADDGPRLGVMLHLSHPLLL